MNLAVSRSYGRQLGLFDPFQPANQKKVAVIGAGTIGSWAVVGLAKMGLTNISVFDDDRIESQNIPNQLYGPNFSGDVKVHALKYLVGVLSGTEITVFNAKFPVQFEGEEPEFEIVVSAVDNMEARMAIWQWVSTKPYVKLYVDARSGGNGAKLYVVQPNKYIGLDDAYYRSLHPDNQQYANPEVQALSEVPCTERSVVDTSMGIASKIVSVVRLWIAKGIEFYPITVDAFESMIVEEEEEHGISEEQESLR